MKIAELEISNIKAIEHVLFRPGTITRLTGRNETGKSSVLDAILAVFEGGSDPGWLRTGAGRGFIRLDLDDGTRITKEITRISLSGVQTSLEVLDPRGVPIAAPQTFITRLGRSWAVDPAKILALDAATAAGRKALSAYLLQVMPISFSPEELSAAIQEQIPVGPVTCDLAGLAKLRKQVDDTRRVIGSQRDDAEAAASQLRKSLRDLAGQEDGTDWLLRATAIERETETARKTAEVRLRDIRDAVRTELQATATDHRDRERALREKFQADLLALQASESADAAVIERTGQDALTAAAGESAPLLAQLNEDFAVARERAQAAAAVTGIREQAKIQERQRVGKLREYADLTGALERLDALRKSKLDNLPVPGLTFEADQVLVNGIVWHHVNKAQRYRIAVQIAALAAGDLQFLVVDDAEHFDPANLAELETAAAEAGFQLMTAAVDSGDRLKIQ